MVPVIVVACCIQILVLIPFTASYESERFRNFRSSWKCKADENEEWSYRGKNGPKYWGRINPVCNGKQQSPIALNRFTAIYSPSLAKLAFNNYDKPVTTATIENNGHTIEITPTDGVRRTIDVQGSTYSLQQFHFHWGDAYYHGAEHTLDGIKYSMELHFVYRNRNNEIAVVAVFFQEQSSSTAELQKIINAFPQVTYKDMSTELTTNLNLNNLLPANPSSYYRYEGSLTTPGCTEGVTWSILTKPLPVGKRQMNAFRSLYSATEEDASSACKLINNFRPIQPLHHRKVFRSQ